MRELDADSHALLLRDSISPPPLHKTLVLLESVERYHHSQFSDHEIFALAKAIDTDISNLHFGAGGRRRSCKTGEISQLAEEIERKRNQFGKTSGFERMYARVTRLYFGGMARHLADFRKVLKPGARLAYVVGHQASYLRVMIRTGRLLAELAKSLG